MKSQSLYVAAALVLQSATLCFADAPPLPGYVGLPSRMQMKPGSTQEDYGEAEFSVAGAPEPVVQRGKHWNAAFAFSDAPDGIEPEAVWAQIKPALTRGGWTFVSDVPGQEKIARYQKDGHDTWFGMWVFGADDLRLDLVEVGSPTIRLKLQRPAAKPETINPESGDFPYLAPIPGSTWAGGRPDDVPMIIDVDVDKTTPDKQVVGSGSIIKSYSLPAPLSSTGPLSRMCPARKRSPDRLVRRSLPRRADASRLEDCPSGPGRARHRRHSQRALQRRRTRHLGISPQLSGFVHHPSRGRRS